MPELPRWIENLVVQTDSYECGQGEFAHTSAATVAQSSTTAPPVSVVRKSRSGAATLRAHAVRAPKLPRLRAPSATQDVREEPRVRVPYGGALPTRVDVRVDHLVNQSL